MPKKAKELKALDVSRLTVPGMYFIGRPAGLILQVTSAGARSWVLRVRIAGKRRDMGLGGYPDVPLAIAQERAVAAREKVRQGIDPIEENKAARSAIAAAHAKAQTFEQCATAYMAAKEHEWKNSKHGDQWRNTLAKYAYPFIGALLVQHVEQAHVLQILEPIWTTKTETASRLRGRIEKVLDYAAASKLRAGDNPARWKGHLDALLATPNKVKNVEHHAALPFSEIGEFMAELRKQAGVGAKALEFAILTAARSGEVRGASWSEVDLATKVWTIPADRMKAGKEHRIPLSDAAATIIQALPHTSKAGLIFPSNKDTPLSDMTLGAVLKRMGRKETVHGFRSTFRDWAGETTAYPREVIEHALSHQLKDKAEAAYARGTLFAKRVLLMADWATYCGKVQADGTVVQIGSGKRRA